MADAITVEMQAITRRAAEPLLPGDSVKAAIRRAARALGIGYRRARSFWYGDPVAVRAIEADRMRAADLLLLAQRERRLEHELAIIKARLDAADEVGASAAAAVARQRADLSARAAATGGKVANGERATSIIVRSR